MGHLDLGQKTVLFMVDGLFGSSSADNTPQKWKTMNNAFPSSVFVSQDNVAIDSVGYDFINNEFPLPDETDGYLMEAALAKDPRRAPSTWPAAPRFPASGCSSTGTTPLPSSTPATSTP